MRTTWKAIICLFGVAISLTFASYTQSVSAKSTDGWTYEDNEWRYFENGEMKRLSWIYSGNEDSWYYVDEDGEMVYGWGTGYVEDYYFDEDGVMVTGWMFLRPNDDGASGTKVSEFYSPSEQASGNWYYFAKNGVMTTGWAKLNGEWCYFGTGNSAVLDKGALAVGLIQIEDGTYCFSEDGHMMTGLIDLDGDYYYFASTGKMQTSKEIYYVDGKWTMIQPTEAGYYTTYILDEEGIGTKSGFTVG